MLKSYLMATSLNEPPLSDLNYLKQTKNIKCFSLKGAKKGRMELTDEQKQEIKEAFDLFDTEGTG